jgi:nucleoside-diphosphate-sugar epimerase
MKILVTGATGFVGACLVRRLVSSGHKVDIFTRKQSNKWRLADILQHVTEHQVELCDSMSVQKSINKIRPNIIYHLAT